MKLFVVNREYLRRLGGFLGSFLLGLSISVYLGLLPLLAVIAGLPVLLAERRMGRRAAQTVALVSLVVTWLLLDQLFFVYVGLGIMVGYSLALLPPHVRFKFCMVQSMVGGFVWVLVTNLAVKAVGGESLLVTLVSRFQQALADTVLRMQSLGAYKADQVSEFEKYTQIVIEALRQQWAYFLFVYLLSSIALTYFVARAANRKAYPAEDLLTERAPIALAGSAVISALLHYLAPAVATGIVSNLWGITLLLMSLAGFMLFLFYLRFLKVGLFWRGLFGFYLVTTPIAWQVLALIGVFDALFDYRFYARNKKQQPSS